MKTKNTRTHRTNSPNKLAPLARELAPLKPLRGGALARAAVNQILLHPETWNQSVWHNECGTKHCFAGWCQILAGKRMDCDSAGDDAYAALGKESEGYGLFGPDVTLQELYAFACVYGKKRKDLKPFTE